MFKLINHSYIYSIEEMQDLNLKTIQYNPEETDLYYLYESLRFTILQGIGVLTYLKYNICDFLDEHTFDIFCKIGLFIFLLKVA